MTLRFCMEGSSVKRGQPEGTLSTLPFPLAQRRENRSLSVLTLECSR